MDSFFVDPDVTNFGWFMLGVIFALGVINLLFAFSMILSIVRTKIKRNSANYDDDYVQWMKDRGLAHCLPLRIRFTEWRKSFGSEFTRRFAIRM